VPLTTSVLCPFESGSEELNDLPVVVVTSFLTTEMVAVGRVGEAAQVVEVDLEEVVDVTLLISTN